MEIPLPNIPLSSSISLLFYTQQSRSEADQEKVMACNYLDWGVQRSCLLSCVVKPAVHTSRHTGKAQIIYPGWATPMPSTGATNPSNVHIHKPEELDQCQSDQGLTKNHHRVQATSRAVPSWTDAIFISVISYHIISYRIIMRPFINLQFVEQNKIIHSSVNWNIWVLSSICSVFHVHIPCFSRNPEVFNLIDFILSFTHQYPHIVFSEIAIHVNYIQFLYSF